MDASSNARAPLRGLSKGSIVSPTRNSPMSPLAKRVESAPTNRKPIKAANLPRPVREQAWSTMRRGGQINVLANVPPVVPNSPPENKISANEDILANEEIRQKDIQVYNKCTSPSQLPKIDCENSDTEESPQTLETASASEEMLANTVSFAAGTAAHRPLHPTGKLKITHTSKRTSPVEPPRVLPAPPPRAPPTETVQPTTPLSPDNADAVFAPRSSSALPPRMSPIAEIDACGMSPIHSDSPSRAPATSPRAPSNATSTMAQIFPSLGISDSSSDGDTSASYLAAISQPYVREPVARTSAQSPDVQQRLSAPSMRDMLVRAGVTGDNVSTAQLCMFLEHTQVDDPALRKRMAANFMTRHADGADAIALSDFVALLDDGRFVEWLALELDETNQTPEVKSPRSSAATRGDHIADNGSAGTVSPHHGTAHTGLGGNSANSSLDATHSNVSEGSLTPSRGRLSNAVSEEILLSSSVNRQISRSVSPLRSLSELALACDASPSNMVQKRALRGMFQELDTERTGMVNLADFGAFISKKKLSGKRVSGTFARQCSPVARGVHGLSRTTASSTSITSNGGTRCSMTFDHFYDVFHAMVDDEGNVDDMIKFVQELSVPWMNTVRNLEEKLLSEKCAHAETKKVVKLQETKMKDSHNTTIEEHDSFNHEISAVHEKLNRSNRQNSLKQSKVKTLQQENDHLGNEIRLLEEQRRELQSSLAQSNAERQRLADVKASLESQVEQGVTEYAELSSRTMLLQDQLRLAEEANAQLQHEQPGLLADVAELRAEVEKLTHEKDVALERLAIVQKDYDDELYSRQTRATPASARNSVNSSLTSDGPYVSTLAFEVPELDTEQTLQETVNRHVAELSELRCTVQELEAKLLAANQTATSAREAQAELERGLADERSQVATLRAACADHRTRAAQAQTTASTQQENADIAHRHLAMQLRHAQQSAESAARTAQSQKETLAEQRDTIARLTDDMADAVAQAETEAQRMLHKLRHRCADFRAVNDALREDVKWLIDENIKLYASVHTATSRKHTAMHHMTAHTPNALKPTTKFALAELTNLC
eukprot:m.1342754 g.1342754  ORF g.1342754 m.1342754 type:complete len:1064 (+) comp24900_c0_seq2:253-3444(+)